MSTKEVEKIDIQTAALPYTDNLTTIQADDLKLAQLGYRSEFKREFSRIETIAFAFSIMGVVASVSSTLVFGLVNGGHVGMVFGWLIPCLFVMFVALSMAELTSAMPTSAGLYYFSAKLAPEKYAPLACWITGWANITGQVTLVCSIDFTCAQMITSAIQVATDGRIILSAGATYGILIAILFSHGIVCSAATSILARLNLFYVLINVGTTVAAIIALLVVSGDHKVSTAEAFTSFENSSGWTNGGWAFMLAFAAPMWTLTGYDSAAHISEEVAGAATSAPIAILVGVAGTATLGWLLLIATSFVITSVEDLLTTTLPLPMGQVFLNVLGKRGMLIIWSFIIVVQYVTGAAQGVDASRVVFAFARDNALPGSRYWKKVNHSTRTPVNAVWLVMAASAVCGVLGFSEAALSSFAGAAVIGLYTSYATPILLRITSGRDKLTPGPFHLGKYSTFVGSIAVAWVTFIVVVLFFPPGQNVNAEDMSYAVVIVMSVFIFASATWIISARHWFHGPVRTIDDKSRTSTLAEKNGSDMGIDT
ncbi:amino acid transporter [Pluteus cervinus]|uniref:Amino acid transporter n=1 Tax=Pluteus cervinus TaxID=181527 RepID=A0ACD3AU77_9AGAR|nr:amino acid transporter [Pluteus cervinus]